MQNKPIYQVVLDYIASIISNKLMENIYPLKILSKSNNTGTAILKSGR